MISKKHIESIKNNLKLLVYTLKLLSFRCFLQNTKGKKKDMLS